MIFSPMVKVVDFWAPWCGPCKIMDPILEELEHELKDITFEKVNVDEKPEESSKLGIMSIPTFVVFKDDEEVGRKVGAVPKAELLKLIQSA